MQELTNEELMELETMQGPEEEILPVKKFETKLKADEFGFIEKALAIFKNQDPNVEILKSSNKGPRFLPVLSHYDKKKK